MDFVALILFLVVYYIRPQEWIIAIQPLKPVTLIMVFAIIAVFMRGKVTWKSVLKTPHDWAIVFYCLWMIVSSPDRLATFHTVYPVFLFYAVTVQVLDNMERIRRFLFWWAMMIFVLASMALLSLYGIDPTGAKDITEGVMRGRLVMGTSIFCNPNALGHSVVPVVLMLYFLLIWKRPIFVRIGAIPLFAVPLYCIYLTLSKGAFVAGFGSLAGALTFGRHKVTQAIIVATALTVGWAGVKTLPRMQEMNKTKTDEAIQGRVQAFQFGLHVLETRTKGAGKDNFATAMRDETGLFKSSHSSYVQVGGELGRIGLFLFLSTFYCCLRTLVTVRTRNDSEERVRRILFSMIISYMVSSWMVDFAYHGVPFLFTGAIAAFHRQLLKRPDESAEDSQTAQQALTSIPSLTISGLGPAPVTAVPTAINQTTIAQTTLAIPVSPSSTSVKETNEKTARPGIIWNRIGWVDIVLCLVMLDAWLRFWRYAIKNF